MVLHTSEPSGNAERSTRPEPSTRRIVAQRTLFTGPTPEAPAALYAVADRGVLVAERDRVTVDGNALVSTNTYFGRFPASYWQRWTSVRSVDVDTVVSGSGRLRLVASESGGEARTIATATVDDAHEEPVRLTAPIDRFVDGGAL